MQTKDYLISTSDPGNALYAPEKLAQSIKHKLKNFDLNIFNTDATTLRLMHLKADRSFFALTCPD